MAGAFGPATPFFRVSDFSATLAHYRDGLGFEVRAITSGDAPFFALLGRGQAQIMIKDVGVPAAPNPKAHADSPWDAFIFVDDPEAYLAELQVQGIAILKPLTLRDDGLRGFEVEDPDGHVCFFGRPD